jgi:hypothetical protein
VALADATRPDECNGEQAVANPLTPDERSAVNASASPDAARAPAWDELRAPRPRSSNARLRCAEQA